MVFRLSPSAPAEVEAPSLNASRAEAPAPKGDVRPSLPAGRGRPPFEPRQVKDLSGMPIETSDQAHLEAVLKTVLDGVITIDSQGRIESFNPSAARIFGYQPEEVIGRNVKMLMPDPYHTEHDGYLQNFLETGERKIIGIGREVSARRKDGTVFPMELGVNEMNIDGERKFVGTIRDITERNEAEASQEEEAERLQAVMNTVLDGLITIDAHGAILSFNPAAVRIFGYEPDEVVGENVKILMPAPYHEEHDGYLQNYLQTGLKKVIGIGREVSARRKDGSIFPMELGINEMAVSGRRCFVGTIRDISERKAAEEAVAGYVRRLKKSNAELDQFAHIASHDLRAPLRGMDNVAKWIEDDLPDDIDDGIREKLGLLRGRVGRMEKLLADILAYSRAGKRESKPENINCEALFEEVVTWVAPREGISVRAATALPDIVTSRTLLEQVFLNLISNAVKHHDRETGEVTLSHRIQGDYHVFTIQDDGPGIPEAFQERVFGMFQTLKSRDKVEGSGIGLAIVKKIVEATGGQVSLRSPLGDRGAAFEVTMPILSVLAPPEKE